MDPSQGEKTTMDRETMDPSQGEKTTDREILAPSEGERTIDLIPKAKGFVKDYLFTWGELAELMELTEKWVAELAEKKRAEFVEKRRAQLANLYREDSWMNFNGENIQGKEAICAKLTSLKPSRIQVLNIECLPVGGTGFDSGTGFSSGTGLVSGTGFSSGTNLSSGFYGMGCGYIWLDGKQDARFFSQTFSLHPTPEGSFAISNSIFIHIGMESCGTVTTLGSSMRPSPV